MRRRGFALQGVQHSAEGSCANAPCLWCGTHLSGESLERWQASPPHSSSPSSGLLHQPSPHPPHKCHSVLHFPPTCVHSVFQNISSLKLPHIPFVCWLCKGPGHFQHACLSWQRSILFSIFRPTLGSTRTSDTYQLGEYEKNPGASAR